MKRLLATALLLVACGPTVPAGGVPRVKPPSALTPVDFIPADLDLVVRVDLARVRESLGREAADDVLSGALDRSGVKGGARKTLAEAEVVWLGLRVADLDEGDHVMVAQHKHKRGKDLAPDALAWRRQKTALAGVRRFLARNPADRAGAARIFTVEPHAAVFVSPVEEYSVERVLERGADPQRGQPEARGLMSLDLREPHLGPRNARRYRSLAHLLEGIVRVRAVLDIHGGELALAGEMRCESPRAAQRVERYLATIKGAPTRFREQLGAIELERSGAVVRIRWEVPREFLLSLFRDEEPPPPSPTPPPSPEP
jgi:hypothetical protein